MVQEKPVTANKIQKKKQRNRTGHKYACAAIKKLVNVPVAGPLWPTVCHFPLLNREILASKKKNKKASDQSSLSGHVTRWQLFLARIANYDTISNRQQQLQQPQQQHQLQQQQHPAHSSNTKQQRLFAASQPANLWMHLAFGPVCPFFWQPKSKTAYYQRFLCLTAWGQRS